MNTGDHESDLLDGDLIMPTERPTSATPPPSPPRIVDSQPPPRGPRLKPPVRLALAMSSGLVGIIVVFIVIASLMGTFAWASPRVNRSEVLTHQFAVTGTPTITINSAVGNLTIVVGPADGVAVRATKVLNNEPADTAQRDLARMSATFSQQGANMTITTDFGVQSPDNADRRIDLAITVPPTTNLNMNASGDLVTIQDITGVLTVSDFNGPLRLSNVTIVGNSKLGNGTGDVNFAGTLQANAKLDIEVSGGNVTATVPATLPAHLAAATNLGKITITGWPKIAITDLRRVGAQATGDLTTPATAHLTLNTNVGDILLRAG